jgi:hypothetical protein
MHRREDDHTDNGETRYSNNNRGDEPFELCCDAARAKLCQIDGRGFLAAGQIAPIFRERTRLLNADEIGSAPTRISAVTAIEQAQSPFPPIGVLDLRPGLGEDGAGDALLSYLRRA